MLDEVPIPSSLNICLSCSFLSSDFSTLVHCPFHLSCLAFSIVHVGLLYSQSRLICLCSFNYCQSPQETPPISRKMSQQTYRAIAPAPIPETVPFYQDELDEYAARLHNAIQNNKLPDEIADILNEHDQNILDLAFEEPVSWGELIPNYHPPAPMTALTLAVEKGNKDTIDVLLAYDAPITLSIWERYALLPITLAAAYENKDLFQFLLQKLHKSDDRERAGGLAMHQACQLKMSWAVEFLIDMGVDMATPTLNMTTLQLAAHGGAYKTMAILIKRGAKVEETQTNGMFETPLHAAEHGLKWYEVVPWAKASTRVLKEEIRRKNDGQVSMLKEYEVGDYIAEYTMKRMLYGDDDVADAYDHSPEFLEFRQLCNNPKCDEQDSDEDRRFLVLWAKLFGANIPPSEQWVILRGKFYIRLMRQTREIHEPTLDNKWRNLKLIGLFSGAVMVLQNQNFGFFQSFRTPPFSLAKIEEETLEKACHLAYSESDDGDSQDAMECGSPPESDNESQDAVDKGVTGSESDQESQDAMDCGVAPESDNESQDAVDKGVTGSESDHESQDAMDCGVAPESDKENQEPEEDEEEEWLKFINPTP
jgi:ankyrin repeat protein